MDQRALHYQDGEDRLNNIKETKDWGKIAQEHYENLKENNIVIQTPSPSINNNYEAELGPDGLYRAVPSLGCGSFIRDEVPDNLGGKKQDVPGVDGTPFKLKTFKETELYYTPSIEDIRVGYECEINSISVNSEDKWYSYTVGFEYENITIARALSEVGKGGIRTPYLTKEQIEAEGWKLKNGYASRELDQVSEWRMEYDFNTHWIDITLFDWRYRDGKQWTYFSGNCPSINELRLIQKMIGI